MHNRVVILFSNIPWDWTADYLRQTAIVLGKSNRVFCLMSRDVIPFRQLFNRRRSQRIVERKSSRIILYTLVDWLPFMRLHWMRQVNDCLNVIIFKMVILLYSGFNLNEWVLWFFYPDVLEYRKQFNRSLMIYDCVDFHEGNEVGIRKIELRKKEADLIQSADVVVANSQVLLNHCRKIRPNSTLVVQGFDMAHLHGSNLSTKKFPHPLIGFVGGLNERLNYDLLLSLVQKHPEWNFVFWGPNQGCGDSKKKTVQLQTLLSCPNVYSGKSERNELANIIAQFDVGIIPYDVTNDFNRYCFPMKIFEYFYLQKPVLSTSIDELKQLKFDGLVYIGDDFIEWDTIIRKLLSIKWSSEYAERQRQFAYDNSWENKIKEIYAKIDIFSRTNNS